MSVNCGIVGLPNVGKSTLFNALTKTAVAEVANYPFCTIEPNVGRVPVPDARLQTLAGISGSAKIIYNQLEFVDIAGLVQGASKGEGLGNKFLGHIRGVDAIIHVLRCFEDENISHVHKKVDPISDAEVVEMELILADVESLERRLPAMEKAARSGDKDAKKRLDLAHEVGKLLQSGQPARNFANADSADVRDLQLITTKPVMYVCNVEDVNVITGNELSKKVGEMAQRTGCQSCCISAKLEAEVLGFEDEEERTSFLSEFGLQESGLNLIVRMTYELLGMMTFFTVGPKEARAWPIKIGTPADRAAGVIHTDFEKGFIKAETISYEDYIQYNGESGCRDNGKMRFEGRDYIVKDGDVIHFRCNR